MPLVLPRHSKSTKLISMRKLSVTLCLTFAVLLGSTGMSASADFQKGLNAIDKGDYATALPQFRTFAEHGY